MFDASVMSNVCLNSHKRHRVEEAVEQPTLDWVAVVRCCSLHRGMYVIHYAFFDLSEVGYEVMSC